MNKITIEEKAHFYDLVESSITVKLGYDELRISLERNLNLLSHRVEDYVKIDQRMFDVIEELEAELIDAKVARSYAIQYKDLIIEISAIRKEIENKVRD